MYTLIISPDTIVYTYLSSFYLRSLTDNFQLIFVLISSVMISLDLWTLDKIDSYDILHLSIHWSIMSWILIQHILNKLQASVYLYNEVLAG